MGWGKSRLTRRSINHLILGIALMLLGGSLPLSAQEAVQQPIPSLAALLAYRCTFDANTQTFQINAAVHDENGLPFEPNAIQLSASVAGGAPFAADSISLATAASRPPLRMVLVLDITDTVPIANIITSLSQDLIPRLQPLDELAMITFGDEVSPPTRFFSDKNRLLSEYLVGLTTVGGDNRVYDAINTAAELFPFDPETRKVILLVTDSGLRQNIAQATRDQIISRARTDGTQINSIGFYSEDRPDEEELRALAAGTRGFSWIYGETPTTPESIESAVRSYLGDFIRLLDSEITLTLDATGIAPTANNLLPITLSAEVAGLGTLTSTISCPYQVVAYSIAFTGMISAFPIRGQTDISVLVAPRDNDTSIIFRVDGIVVQNSPATVYTLDAAQFAPGDHLIEAQLWNQNNETLAATDAPLAIFTQQTLDLSTDNQTTDNLDGVVEFQVSFNSNFPLPAIQLSVARTLDPEAVQRLGIARVAEDARAVLNVDDIARAIGMLFPEIGIGESLQVVASAPNPTLGLPPLAISDSIMITLATAPGAIAITPAPSEVTAVTLDYDNFFTTLPVLSIVFFGALNIILFLAVRKSRIRRLIAYQDNSDLSPQLMSLTVYRGGVPQPYSLAKKTMMVGRGSTNDLNLGDDPNISRQHGVVMWRRNHWYYSNRKERLVTRINRRRYRGLMFHRLEPMSEIQIGGTTMVFHSSAQQDLSDFIKTDL